MFLNGADANDAKAIIQLLSAKAKEHEKAGFKAFVYFLDGTPEQLKKLNKELKADNIALALLPKEELESTLKGYAINKKARSTVLVYKARVISDKVVNFNAKDDSAALKKAIDKVCK